MYGEVFHVLIGLLALCICVENNGPILSTHVGKFQGRTLDFGDKGQVDVFLGVPFAKPPIKERRFEKPVDADTSDRLNPAIKTKPACPQPPNKYSGETTDEDCLYLNVFKPKDKDKKGGYPALVFIHGGAFQIGSSGMHSLDAVAENFASQGIVFIVPQYRLGILGFASTGPEAFAGNYGLWDMRRALLWIRKNAKALDINPKRITIGGYSAGSAAVGALSVGEHTRDLFAQAIQMSGSPFGEWATSNKAITLTEKIATHLKCNSQSSSDVKKCLRNFKYNELYETFKKRAEDPNDFNLGEFSPRLDADFFTSDLPHLIETSPPKPTLSTLTESEGILFVCFGTMPVFNRHALTDEQFETFDEIAFSNFVRDKVATDAVFGSKAKEVQNKIIKFYLGNSRNEDNRYYLNRYAKLIGDILFVVPQLREMRYKAEAGWPVYMLKNVHRKPLKMCGRKGKVFDETTHEQEYGPLFGLTHFDEFTEEDKQHKQMLLAAIVNFVKNRSPKTEESPNFTTVDRKHPLIYSEISTKIELKSPLFGDEFNFWNELSNDYDFDLIRGIHKTTLRARTEL